ncbi:MAG TPA: nucleotidyltransferase family protein [Oscillatoriaceae cyanobacterium M33_DOE_052]|uniref:DNA polymerase subunit beta n=1 Tax=Planktothricoides sp. SpSt-374 TaxID=2282167 RepID=A0A7C3ZJQ9_9CYAN|nr:nucleotidyltransferase family protein [Oscillatoriaceae cyanobacterium M33_DOE_052]
MSAITSNIHLPLAEINQFCHRWHITEFALFGSVLREDFRHDSDIDVLVTFDPQFQRGFAETLQMRQELETLFGREVDLIVKAAIERSENWLRRQNILESARVIYPIKQFILIPQFKKYEVKNDRNYFQ